VIFHSFDLLTPTKRSHNSIQHLSEKKEKEKEKERKILQNKGGRKRKKEKSDLH
jgi:hypothetical protein